MLKGNFDAVVKNFQQEKKLKKLFSDEALIYIHTLIMDGKVPESQEFITHYRFRFPKDKDFIELERGIKLFSGDLDHTNYTKNQKANIRFLRTHFNTIETHKEKYLKEILELEDEFYLPSKYDYAFALNELSFDDQIKKVALKKIVDKQGVLFPKTGDFFELALAYKALAVIKIHEKDLSAAKRFIKIAKDYVFKMRSIWLIEDLSIYDPVWKTTKTSTKFASLYPQYLIKLRDEFANFLI